MEAYVGCFRIFFAAALVTLRGNGTLCAAHLRLVILNILSYAASPATSLSLSLSLSLSPPRKSFLISE